MPTLILDFDQTLYDTSGMKRAKFIKLKKYLLKKSLTFYKTTADSVIKKHGMYLLEEHLKAMVKAEHHQAALRIAQHTPYHKFLYPDVRKFFQRYKKFKIIILTFGDDKFQQEKIQACKFKGVDKVIITLKKKYLEFEKIINKYPAPYYFIDDKTSELDLVKKHYPEVIALWMRRANGANRNKPGKEFMYKISNLNLNLEKYV